MMLKIVTPDEVSAARLDPVDADALETVRKIVDDVRSRGEIALREHAEGFGDIKKGGPLFIGRDQLEDARSAFPAADLELLERTAGRIRTFAQAQRASLDQVDIPVPGGAAGHDVSPVQRAGCYAPGGRYPLPSSVLMTAVTARVAGVEEVWVASPKPAPATLAAAAVSGADGLLAAGGAQAIAALAYGAGALPPCDVVVGPGNRYVTAAKQLVSGRVAIDMLAGPSELLVLADGEADPETVAADLLAQAEHDPEAVPILVALDAELIAEVESALTEQLAELPDPSIASASLGNGFAVLAGSLDEAIDLSDRIAPEHLELHVKDAREAAGRCRHYGGLFIGQAAAEVLGDYGAGPNHTLPTGGTARYAGGLSVFDFLRIRTWLRIDDPEGAAEIVADAERLAEIEGLTAHARSAARRRP